MSLLLIVTPEVLAKARARTLMAAKVFNRLMTEFDGETQYCGDALTELLDAVDQLETLETLAHDQAVGAKP